MRTKVKEVKKKVHFFGVFLRIEAAAKIWFWNRLNMHFYARSATGG
jgi:hypothetical protein